MRVERLEDLINRFGIDRVDLLKMDVEGAEADLLRGARRALELIRRVVFEYHSHALLEQCAELLEAAGFVCRGSRDTWPDSGIGVAYFSRK